MATPNTSVNRLTLSRETQVLSVEDRHTQQCNQLFGRDEGGTGVPLFVTPIDWCHS